MHTTGFIDPGRHVDWSKTSIDYAAHRPGPPQRLYDMLAAMGVGLPGQHLLDLGTGTGLLAREFARRGVQVCATDIAPGQIEAARIEAQRQGLTIDFRTAPAEACPYANAQFDVVTAGQCWMYFDPDRACAEVKRVLKPGGVLVTTHFSWLPHADAIARASEQLVLQFNPAWRGAHWSGKVPDIPEWAAGRAKVRGMFWFDTLVPFTAESWRGRMRACRGVGATLTAPEVDAFDAAHAAVLARIAPPDFAVWHRVDAHLLHPLER